MSRRKKNEKRVRVTKPKRFLLWLLVLILIAAGVLLINSSYFDIKEVLVYGCGSYDQDYIVQNSGISLGENILKMDEPSVKDRLETDPFIEVKDIKREFPATVAIYMEQRTCYMEADYNGTVIVLDRKAHALAQKQNRDELTLYIRGLNMKEPVSGKIIESNEENQVQHLLDILNNADRFGISGLLQSVDMSNQADVILYMKGNIAVKLGFAVDIDKKLALYTPSINSVQDKLSQGGTLDLSIPGREFFIPNAQ